MMRPCYKKMVVFMVRYTALEAHIREFFGNPNWEIVDDLECSNGTTHEIDVTDSPPDAWDLMHLEQIRAGKQTNYCLRILMHEMCRSGELEPGTYMVKVSW